MTIESPATYISDLNASYPEGSADRSTADDHLRLIKSCVKATFPNVAGAVSVTHTQLNLLAGLTKTLTTLVTEVGALSLSVSAIKTDITAIESKFSLSISAIKTDTTQFSLSISAINTDVDKFSLSISAINTAVAALESDAGKFSLSISAINTAVAAMGITVMTPQATTSGSSKDFTGIAAGTKHIMVAFSGVGTDGSNGVQVRIGDSGGVETTGYTGSDTTSFKIFPSANGHETQIHGIMHLILANDSSNTWVASFAGYDGYASNRLTLEASGGTKSLSGVLDRVQILTTGDTFDGGAVNVIYE